MYKKSKFRIYEAFVMYTKSRFRVHIKLLSDKQIDSFQNSNSRINIFEGPVRAGKSFVALLRWLEFCRSGPIGPLIICGRTDKTIKRNIINPLIDLVGSSVQYSIGKGEVQLYDRLMYVVGADNERASAKIQGSEFAGALIDELTLLPESFVKMLLSRLSIPKAQLFASTNPDSPYHWVKTDFINRKNDLDCSVFSFSIDDNPSLDEEYKTQLKKEYQGLWYKRYIEGLWVVAEGGVYDFFDERQHVIDYPPMPARKYYVSIDYGTQNPCVFLLFGHNTSAFPNIWCEKEYYYDSKKKMKQKSDYEYADDFIKFLDGITPEAIYIDPSAASLKVELRRRGIGGIKDAVNDVLPGIRFQGQLITNGTYKICAQCTETIKEYSNYVWDEKSAKLGTEKPVKVFDHCFSENTLILTIHGEIPINEVKKGDYVITQYGVDKVIGTWESIDPQEIILLNIDGKETYVTPSHKYLTKNRGYVQACKLLPSDILYTIKPYQEEIWKEKKSNGTVEHTSGTQKVKIHQLGYILDAQIDTCIGISGSIIEEKSKEDIIYTTKTETQEITQLKILCVFHEKNTLICTGKRFPIDLQKILKYMETGCNNSQNLGMHQKKALRGIVNMQKNNGKVKNQNWYYVKIVKKNFTQSTINQNFAQIIVNRHIEEVFRSIISKKNALHAEKRVSRVVIVTQSTVKIVQQNFVGRKEKVYNLTTEKFNNFIANNFSVSNCKDAERYFLYTHFFNKSGPGMTEEDANRLERSYYFKY